LPDAYINRALAKEGVENYRGAVEDLNEALERGTPRTRVYFMRAYAKQKAGDARGAQLDTHEGLRLEPADEKSWIARGLARLDAEPKAALADFDKALELDPRSIDALENKAHVLSERLNRTEEAVQALNKAVELNPDFVPARAGRGVLLARQGKRDAALEDASESLVRDTKAPNLYQVAGIYALCSKENLQNHLKALELLSSALRSGFGWDLVDRDTDLDLIRNDPEFGRVVAAAKALQSPPGRRP
jgi:tetratricopeptide (TPR) repeat protein